MKRTSVPASGQLLPGARPISDRLFFAVYPDPESAQRIVELASALRAKHGVRGKPLAADRVHVTLHHLGDHSGLPQALLSAVSDVAACVSARAFDICFDRAASFPHGARNRPCVLRSDEPEANPELRALHGELATRLVEAGVGRHLERRFTPHATLLYDEHIVACEAVAPIRWTVHRFTLVHSLIGRGIHRQLAHWTLSA